MPRAPAPRTPAPRTLVLGGARSGKSGFAETRLKTSDSPSAAQCTYVATARPWPGDDDFAARIREHVVRRPAHWVTEDQRDVVDVLRDPAVHAGPVLVDDIGTWLTHVIDSHDAWESPRGTVRPAMEELINAVACWPGLYPLVLVSPEVGLSVIPAARSARLFRDELGWLNAELAERCEEVALVVAGQALLLKSHTPTGDGGCCGNCCGRSP